MARTCQKRQEFKIPFLCLVYESCPPSHLSLRTSLRGRWQLLYTDLMIREFAQGCRVQVCPQPEVPTISHLLLPPIPRTVSLSICIQMKPFCTTVIKICITKSVGPSLQSVKNTFGFSSAFSFALS